MATGEIAQPVFDHLLAVGPRPLALVTQPDKPVGRHRAPVSPAIKLAALAAGIPVLQPERVGDAAAELAALDPDILVVMAYGQILRQDLLGLPRLATINLHASLLPRHRGASCIQAAILAGDPATGITTMHMAPRLDAGDVILARSLAITDGETGGSLHDRLASLAPEVLMETLRRLADGSAERRPQDEALATYAPKLDRDSGRIDWSVDAATIARRIRAYDPWPGSFTRVREGESWRRLKIFPPVSLSATSLPPCAVAVSGDSLIIGCGDGALQIGELQAEGSRRMTAADYLRGRQPIAVE